LEAVDAIAAVDAGGPGEAAVAGDVERAAVAHLEEELGDLLFQVFFHAALAAEAGRFTMADVARGIHDKLVARHPHVFGGVAAATPDQVATNWEALKKAEKGRRSVTEGIPAALPALAVAAKLQRKARTLGMAEPDPSERGAALAVEVGRLGARVAAGDGRADVDGEGGPAELAVEVGELLFGVVDLSRRLGVDAEGALRVRAAAFRATIEVAESVGVAESSEAAPAADTTAHRRQ
jgi:uncharacterized protein YabN with tetrapyrrole methylase and pyrophosphatase domain